MTSAAISTTLYASAVTTVLTRALAVELSGIASVTVTGVLVATMYHAFVRRDLFPNDVSIAITQRPKAKFSKILAHLRSSSSDMKDLVLSLSKPAQSDTETDASVTTTKSRAEP